MPLNVCAASNNFPSDGFGRFADQTTDNSYDSAGVVRF